jgi:hypothetical protein
MDKQIFTVFDDLSKHLPEEKWGNLCPLHGDLNPDEYGPPYCRACLSLASSPLPSAGKVKSLIMNWISPSQRDVERISTHWKIVETMGRVDRHGGWEGDVGTVIGGGTNRYPAFLVETHRGSFLVDCLSIGLDPPFWTDGIVL